MTASNSTVTARGNSYSRILRSSSIVGGAQVANYLISLVRGKLIAILIGPTGVGLIGLYTSAIGMVGMVSGLGVSSSAVREIVHAYSRDDADEAARTVRVLRRACFAMGILGCILSIVFSQPISAFMTGSQKHAGAVALLGLTLLFGAISSGQLALLQGLRRIGDLARANVLGALAGSLISVPIYFVLREEGVAPALIAASMASLGCSYWFARRVAVPSVAISWAETWFRFNRLLGLGLALMWGGAVGACVEMLIRSVITRKFGIEALGIYTAAWSLSGIFASFVLSAMGADFYPRLTATIHDKAMAAREVNEQTEIGVLLALPGLLASIAFAPLAIRLLYTPEFVPAADLLSWMTLGVFGRVVSWPLGYVQLATGASRMAAATETLSAGVQAFLTIWLLERYGIMGAAYAVAVTSVLYSAVMLWVTQSLIGFFWSTEVRRLLLVSGGFVIATFLTRFFWMDLGSIIIAIALTLAGTLYSVRGLAERLGDKHRLVRWLFMVPGGHYLFATATATATPEI